MPGTTEGAAKAWKTIRRNKRSAIAHKAWKTRRANATKRSAAACKAWKTRRGQMSN